jgi:hypothetical protein
VVEQVVIDIKQVVIDIDVKQVVIDIGGKTGCN